ncbi:MAG: T9SS type A sorting domain-containing protein [Candidatus Marinimicrobia bacterium]|nr:T9SS type A sorting domain-containing protein [Candidatus Neomarinimicrobiota bacterium]
MHHPKNNRNITFIIAVIIIVLPGFGIGQPVPDTEYYPLHIGDWKEYSGFVGTFDVYTLLREGILDTTTINGTVYFKQYVSNPMEQDVIFIRNDTAGNTLYYNFQTELEDTLYKKNSINTEWLVWSSMPMDSIFAYQLDRYFSVQIDPLIYTEPYCTAWNFRQMTFLYWQDVLAPGVGKVLYIPEGNEHYLRRLHLNSVDYFGSYTLFGSDTLYFNPGVGNLTVTPNQNGFLYSFQFFPHQLNWESFTITAIAFRHGPIKEKYFSTSRLLFQDSTEYDLIINSLNLPPDYYWDVMDERFVPSLTNINDTLTLTGTYSERNLLLGDSANFNLSMNPDSFQVAIVVNDIEVSVDPKDDSTVQSRELRVEPAYPNPFNPETHIKYNLPNNSNFHIKIFNINGELVYRKDFVNQIAGQHTFYWNGIGYTGQKVPSGLYLVSMVATNTLLNRYYSADARYSKTQKIILLK